LVSSKGSNQNTEHHTRDKNALKTPPFSTPDEEEVIFYETYFRRRSQTGKTKPILARRFAGISTCQGAIHLIFPGSHPRHGSRTERFDVRHG
jgi:hypothetical protein